MAEKKAEEKKGTEKEGSEEKGALAAWEPFAELRDWRPLAAGLPARVERWLRDLEAEWPGLAPRGGWPPALDVNETDKHYAVTVELPGARREDVTVECDEGVLTIRGEKKSEREEKKEKRRFVERRYGTFSRSFSLPRDADAEHIEASFQNGVLTLTIPKSEAAKPRTVAIK